ncbi:MAG: hydroxymethylbilane synthase [Bacteroidetes bacterium]|nr:hydroxymethylbilane synthase [Bacteroidota bacterium]
MDQTIIIGTRGSELALWQANYTKNLLEQKGHKVEIKIIATEGDRSQQWNTSFDKLAGKGFFTKELEEALLKKEIDLAVHSHKDLPTESPQGLMIGGVSKREDPSDMLLIRNEKVDDSKKWSLKQNAIVGTSSARRKSQLLAFRPDVELKDLRGNVPTRIKKLRDGEYDAILLATAGIERLELDIEDLHSEKLDTSEFVPAPAQGVLAWQIREEDENLLSILDEISDFDVLVKINIERTILNLFDGGCQLPLGAYCDADPDDEDRLRFKVWTSVASAWDKQPKQLYFETSNTDGFADEITEKIKGIKPCKVYVTKTFREDDYLPRALKRLDFDVEGKSLIEFKQFKFKEVPQADWIFFSSKHSVRYFFSQKPDVTGRKFGCVGTSTSAELRAHGHRADFIGQSTDTKLVGKQFAAKVGSSKVVFPIAKDSMQNIQWQMPKRDNVINLNVYATIKHSIEIDPTVKIVVFTSPANVEAYFEKNKWQPGQFCVAMGDATAVALNKKKVKVNVKPTSFDDLGLFRSILSLS